MGHLVLLDLSASFDTVYHDNVFIISEKYDEITGSVTTAFKITFLKPITVSAY